MQTVSSFALRNFKGTPIQYVSVVSEDHAATKATPVKQPTHHIILMDRSGSMYYDLPDTKAMVEKLLTLSEFNDPTQKISLISYSSQGDVKIHFAKVTVADVLAPASPYVKEIRSIQVTGMTCISQSLVLAASLVDDKDTTCITLHTDGYANDRSPSAERIAITNAVADLAARPNLYINTIAYRSSSDFTLLSSVANSASGVCMQATSIQQVYGALHTAQQTLAGNMAPALVLAKHADYTVFCSTSAGKVLGTDGDMTVRGLKDTDTKMSHRFTFISEAAAAGLPATDPKAILAYARAQISEGNINAAKYALCAIKSDLLPKHFRALVATEVAAMAADIEAALFTGTIGYTTNYGLPTGSSVLDVLAVLSKFSKSLRVQIPALLSKYKRQGVKRVGGVRNDDGSLTPPEFELKADEDPLADVLSFDFNRTTATVNMLTSRKAKLVKCATGSVITEVAGIDVSSLRDFRNYTIVSDGQVCTPVLPIKISDKRCHKALVDLGLTLGAFDPNAFVNIVLGDLPLIDFDQSFKVTDDVFFRLCKLTAASKVLSACLKEASEAYTAEQVAELKAHYMSGSLYFSGPTTTHYADLQDALSRGDVDTRLSYKIEIGHPDITALSKLPSANAFLDRRFTLSVAGNAVDKPKMPSVLDGNAKFEVKSLSARVKLTQVDDLLFPIFKSFLLDGGNGEFADSLRVVGVNGAAIDAVLTALAGSDTDAKVDAIGNLNREVASHLEEIYQSEVSPLVFYVGATGLVPDALKAKAYTAEQLVAAYPDVALSKDEKEGMFYVLPNRLMLTVFVKGEYYTTDTANI